MKTLITLGILLFWMNTHAQRKKEMKDVNLDNLINETQFQLADGKAEEVVLVWWIPTQFWSSIYANDDSVDEETAEQITTALDKYTMVIAIDGTISGMGKLKSRPKSYIAKNLVLKDGEENEYSPIDTDDVNFETMVFVNILEPMLKKLLGQLGEGMHVMVFEKEAGGAILDPYGTEGSITYDNEECDLQLPLSSLIEEKKCPEDGAPMNGKWEYCPYHGDKLDN